MVVHRRVCHEGSTYLRLILTNNPSTWSTVWRVIWGDHPHVHLTDTMTQQQIKEMQCVALVDYRKGLLTKTQLLNIIYRLDRKSFISL